MRKHKAILVLITCVMLLAACGPTEADIQVAIKKTQMVQSTSATATQQPTATPEPTLGLTNEQKEEIIMLQQQLEEIDQEIEDARKESEEYSGGLIKTYIEERIQIYELSRALVEQRIIALESGVQTTIEINGPKPDPEKLEQLLEDIEAQKLSNEEIQAEVAKYTGGLIYATYQSALATGRYTVTLLEHLYFLAEYGHFPSE